MAKDLIEQFYDSQAQRKLELFVKGNLRIELACGLIERFLPGQKFRALEIGCGIGEVSSRVADSFPASSVVATDISGESIAIAQTAFPRRNLQFFHGLPWDMIGCEPFDVVYLVDVIEHIPATERRIFFERLSSLINEVTGRVILTFPTPQHLAYARTHTPSEIQPVDEDVTIEVLLEVANSLKMGLVYYSLVSVWSRNDYGHAVLANPDFSRGLDAVKRRGDQHPVAPPKILLGGSERKRRKVAERVRSTMIARAAENESR